MHSNARLALRTSAAFLLVSPSLAFAATPSNDGEGADWPQWRGPARDGLSTETAWTSEGKELWSIDCGLGYSSVAVANGLLYTIGYDKEAGLDIVWCLDAKTGDEVWAHTYEAKIWDQFHTGGSLTTPSVAGDVVYTLNREGTFFCLDAKTGEVQFEKHFVKEHEVTPPTWGFSASPLVLDDAVIVNVGKVVSMDAKGEVQWVSKDYGHAYSTPVDCELRGKQALVVFNGSGVVILDRKDGSELVPVFEWKTQYDVNAASPVLVAEDALFISSGYNHGSALLAIGEDGFEPVWENKKMRNKMSGCILIDGNLYGFDEAGLKCLDLDGEERWSARELGNGAMAANSDRLIALSEKGELVIAKATPDGYEELSKQKLFGDDDGVFWTVPVLADGVIYSRSSLGKLIATDHRAER